MHPILDELKNELNQLVAVVTSSTTDLRAVNVINGNLIAMAGVDREDLARRAAVLAEWIDAQGGDEVTDESQLSKYPQRLQALRGNLVPQLWNGNAVNAVPAYLITLDSLERCLRPILSPNFDRIGEDSKALRQVRAKIRALTAAGSELEPKFEALQQMAREITQAYEAADRLPTDLQELREARSEIQALLESSKQDGQDVQVILDSARSAGEQLASSSSDAKKIIENCDNAMRASTTRGLAGAFHDRAESLRRSLWPWVMGLIGALIVGAVVGGWQLHQLSESIQASTAPTIVWTRIAVSLLSVGAPVWFAWLATKQIGQRFRLAEDYAYKASISKAYEGYRREAVQLDEDFQKRLFASALARLDEQPLRFVEHETHGSPWHELLASDVVKDAVRIAPNLISEWKQKATDTVLEARAGKKSRDGANSKSQSTADANE